MPFNAQQHSSGSSSTATGMSSNSPYPDSSASYNSSSATEFTLPLLEQGSYNGNTASVGIDPHFGLMMLLEQQQQRPSSRCGMGPSLMQMMMIQQQSQQQCKKLFIGGLGQVNDDALRQYYAQWGQVVDCIVIRDPTTRSSRGFGFVTYATAEMADVAMAHRPHIINGKAVDAKRAVPRERMNLILDNDPIPFFMNIEPDTGCRLHLSGLNWEWHTLDTLRTHFGQYGTLEQLEMVAYPRGFGSLVYEEPASAQLCLAAGEQQSINGHLVEVKLVNDVFAQARPNSSDSALSSSSAQPSSALNLL